MTMLFLLSSLALIHVTTCTVYTVTPDDHYYPNTTCHHCHNLQHYLLNITKYFTSNTQLLFLPGLHHLHTHLIIQNVHNISLIGSTANGTTLDIVIIQCKSSVGIVMTNITNLTIMNMIISDSVANFSLKDLTIRNESCVVLFNCFQAHIQNVTITYTHMPTAGLLALNVLGKSVLNDIKCNVLFITYKDSSYAKSLMAAAKQNELIINKYKPKLGHSTSKLIHLRYADLAINFNLLQTSFNVSVKLTNSNFKHLTYYRTIISFTINECLNNIQNKIFIKRCHFEDNYFTYYLISMFPESCSTGTRVRETGNIIIISNCVFIKNCCAFSIFPLIRIDVDAFIHITECLFHNNFMPILEFWSDSPLSQGNSVTIVKSHLRSSLKRTVEWVIRLVNVKLLLKGPVVFHNYKATNLLEANTIIIFHNYVEFSNVKVRNLIRGTAVYLVDDVYVNITNNLIKKTIFSMTNEFVFYPLCYFQYYRKLYNHTKQTIFIKSTNYRRIFDNATRNINCKWNRIIVQWIKPS